MLLAKSDGTTLQQHIIDCLTIWEQLQSAVPGLPDIFRNNTFWTLLFVTVYLHDFGKCHKEFQKYLQNTRNIWFGQRHELYSLPFVDKVNLNEFEKLLIKRAILGHHKDFETLLHKYHKNNELLTFELNYKFSDHGFRFHPEDYCHNLQAALDVDNIKSCILDFNLYAQKYGLLNINMNSKVDLNNQKHPYETIANKINNYDINSVDYWQNLLLWGCLKICDHYGSAGIKQLPILNDSNFSFLFNLQKELQNEGKDFYSHQKKCFYQNGNCLLVAPTGSGKTEAAIGWLHTQLKEKQGRTFYVLPYTASINAMHKRLAKNMDTNSHNGLSELIGIQHGKLTQYLATFFEEIYDNQDNLKNYLSIEELNKQYRMMIHPLKVITPFQLLKFLYGVKGFELGLTQLAGAKIIFDEIHAYDPATFAQILVMIHFLTHYFHCSAMVMTATLPTFMLNELIQVLGNPHIINADTEFLNQKPRHNVKIVEGNIFESLKNIERLIAQKKRILIVCNTVQRAQNIYESIIESFSFDKNEMCLIHGRFNSLDRLQNENKAFNKNTKILIGTQAIEVSLDIDFDLIYTEPAPLDALLQRFGRVNRKGIKSPCPVFIFKESGPFDHFIYPKEIIQRTLNRLEQVSLLYENQIQSMLDYVYPDWEPEEKREFELTKNTFQLSLQALQPYSDCKENEEKFYEKFTGIEVLPACFYKKYKSKIQNFDFIGAEQLLVTIHKNMFFKLKNNPDGSQIESKIIPIEKNNTIKNYYVTVAKCVYTPELGLTDDFMDIDDDFII